MTMDPDALLDSLLRRMRHADLDPLTARTARVAAERRLGAGARRSSPLARFEAPFLAALALVHLLWAAVRLLTLAH